MDEEPGVQTGTTTQRHSQSQALFLTGPSSPRPSVSPAMCSDHPCAGPGREQCHSSLWDHPRPLGLAEHTY